MDSRTSRLGIAATIVSAVLSADLPAQTTDPAASNARSTIVDRTVPAMRFDPTADLADWHSRLRERLVGILALPAGPHGSLNSRVARVEENERYALDRVAFTAEPGERVPAYLLTPSNGRPPYPVMIYLQGHSPGMHISVRRAKTQRDRKSIAGGRDIAVQAVAHGWPPWPSSSAGSASELRKALRVETHR